MGAAVSRSTSQHRRICSPFRKSRHRRNTGRMGGIRSGSVAGSIQPDHGVQIGELKALHSQGAVVARLEDCV